MAELSEWLKIMLGEVSRKSDEDSRAVAEGQARAAEAALPGAEPVAPATSGTR
jgi:hypothetical protein